MRSANRRLKAGPPDTPPSTSASWPGCRSWPSPSRSSPGPQRSPASSTTACKPCVEP